MRINSIEDKCVQVSMDADELVSLSNMIYEAQQMKNDDLKPKERELYAQIMTARDLCQYGHVDGFTLRHIVMEKYKASPEKGEMARLREQFAAISGKGEGKANE